MVAEAPPVWESAGQGHLKAKVAVVQTETRARLIVLQFFGGPRLYGSYSGNAARPTSRRYSALMPANRITFAHFSVSSEMNLANSAGDVANAEPPSAAKRALIAGSARHALISRFNFRTISIDVSRGATMPLHPVAS